MWWFQTPSTPVNEKEKFGPIMIDIGELQCMFEENCCKSDLQPGAKAEQLNLMNTCKIFVQKLTKNPEFQETPFSFDVKELETVENGLVIGKWDWGTFNRSHTKVFDVTFTPDMFSSDVLHVEEHRIIKKIRVLCLVHVYRRLAVGSVLNMMTHLMPKRYGNKIQIEDVMVQWHEETSDDKNSNENQRPTSNVLQKIKCSCNYCSTQSFIKKRIQVFTEWRKLPPSVALSERRAQFMTQFNVFLQICKKDVLKSATNPFDQKVYRSRATMNLQENNNTSASINFGRSSSNITLKDSSNTDVFKYIAKDMEISEGCHPWPNYAMPRQSSSNKTRVNCIESKKNDSTWQNCQQFNELKESLQGGGDFIRINSNTCVFCPKSLSPSMLFKNKQSWYAWDSHNKVPFMLDHLVLELKPDQNYSTNRAFKGEILVKSDVANLRNAAKNKAPLRTKKKSSNLTLKKLSFKRSLLNRILIPPRDVQLEILRESPDVKRRRLNISAIEPITDVHKEMYKNVRTNSEKDGTDGRRRSLETDGAVLVDNTSRRHRNYLHGPEHIESRKTSERQVTFCMPVDTVVMHSTVEAATEMNKFRSNEVQNCRIEISQDVEIFRGQEDTITSITELKSGKSRHDLVEAAGSEKPHWKSFWKRILKKNYFSEYFKKNSSKQSSGGHKERKSDKETMTYDMSPTTSLSVWSNMKKKMSFNCLLSRDEKSTENILPITVCTEKTKDNNNEKTSSSCLVSDAKISDGIRPKISKPNCCEDQSGNTEFRVDSKSKCFPRIAQVSGCTLNRNKQDNAEQFEPVSQWQEWKRTECRDRKSVQIKTSGSYESYVSFIGSTQTLRRKNLDKIKRQNLANYDTNFKPLTLRRSEHNLDLSSAPKLNPNVY